GASEPFEIIKLVNTRIVLSKLMSERKSSRIFKNTKHLSIGPPTNFEHRHHMIYNATDAWFRGVPTQWPNLIKLKNPGSLFTNVALKYNWGSSRIFYGYKKDQPALLNLKFVALTTNILAIDLKSELTFLIEHSNENIVEFIEAYLWDSCCLLVFVEEEDITLHELINSIYHVKSSTKILTQQNVAYITHSILNGVRYIHSNKYSHRDIKSDTIMISSNGK
ncbi:hypothetical protein MXB_4537, partial [Myxobolus squamalis]